MTDRNFTSLSVGERRYSNIDVEVLAILPSIEKFYHYCFAREVNIITDHKTLVTNFKKDVATLSQRLQGILLRIHQYRFSVLYKPRSNLFMGQWLSRQNHKGNKDDEILCMKININAMDTATGIPNCITI